MIKKMAIFAILGIVLFSCDATKNKATVTNAATELNGTWELNYITGPRIAFDGLYPNKKPTITFDTKENRVSGNNSCNSFTGKLNVDGHKINFRDGLATTKMMCIDNQGEQVFMDTMLKITSYDITDNGKTLNFISGDIAMMRFTKK
ncbi:MULTISPECIES: META domain-containing protein [unclassified Flavobacterium]|uniref:META domain-containing protein n=1 Tax=unclassified Flavobacterium TaxID=196869 RepID=UPI000F0C8F3A|nr:MULTISPECIES: META domain-containing protein [unclassified Flavobacterium]AYN04706.1 META domain-containing protein [Flavobacterium sp. 140616W15]MCD0474703.1 META domain-containing protein [Flavobacterium sp. EDS]